MGGVSHSLKKPTGGDRRTHVGKGGEERGGVDGKEAGQHAHAAASVCTSRGAGFPRQTRSRTAACSAVDRTQVMIIFSEISEKTPACAPAGAWPAHGQQGRGRYRAALAGRLVHVSGRESQREVRRCGASRLGRWKRCAHRASAWSRGGRTSSVMNVTGPQGKQPSCRLSGSYS